MLKQLLPPLRASRHTPPLTPRHRLAYGARAGFIAAVILLVLWRADLFADTRLRLSNVLFVPHDTQGKVVIIAVDNASLSAYGRAMVTWSRTLHGDLVDIVSSGGARVIAFDVLFSEEAPGDEDFIAAIERARAESPAHTRVVMPVVGAQRETATQRYQSFLTPHTEFQAAPIAVGHANITPDQDGTVRRQPTRAMSNQGDAYYSFAIVTYLTYLRISPALFEQVLIPDNRHLHAASQRAIPIDANGQMLINFFGEPQDAAFPTYSFRAVLEGEVDPSVFEDKIVLVGLMNHSGLGEMYAVPLSYNQTIMSGVEIHANLLETLLQNRFLREQSRLTQVALIVFLSLSAGMLYEAAYRRWFWFVAAVGGYSLSVTLGLLVYFNFTRIIPNLLYMLLALGVPALVVLIQHNTFEARQRRRAELLWQSMLVASQQRLNLDSTLPYIAQDIRQIVTCSTLEIWLWDATQNRHTRAYTHPAQPDTPDTDSAPPTPPALLAIALESGVIAHRDRQLAVPLIWQGELRGGFFCAPVRRMRSGSREILTLLAWQTAAFIVNTALYAEAQALNDLKTRMLRMASHDLKNPLSVIFMYADTLERSLDMPDFERERQTHFLERIHHAGHMMLDIINQILDLEQARRGLLMTDTCQLPQLLREAIERHETSIQQHQHTLTTEIPTEFPPLRGDPAQLREAFGNLISNAAKYTPDGGKISVRLHKQDHVARITVQDNGYGIPADQQSKLFEEFYRAKTPQTAHISGTGLGLSLIKAIVDAHKGRVWFESTAGEGSTFYIELPLNMLTPAIPTGKSAAQTAYTPPATPPT